MKVVVKRINIKIYISCFIPFLEPQQFMIAYKFIGTRPNSF